MRGTGQATPGRRQAGAGGPAGVCSRVDAPGPLAEPPRYSLGWSAALPFINMCLTRHCTPRAARSPLPAILAVLTLVLAAGAGLVEPVHGAGGYVAAEQTEPGIPAGTFSSRTVELQLPDRSRDRGHGGARRAEGPGVHGGAAVSPTAAPGPRPAPQDAARSALARAGRLSSPATAPPNLS
jgi:hypothetical protein